MLGKPKAKARPKPPAELPLCDPDFPDFRDPSLEEGSMLDRPPGGLKWGSNGVNQLLQTRFILGCTRGLLGRESRDVSVYGNIRPYMVIYVHIWQHTSIYGNIRPYMVIYNLWP
jgi:hypothetical protein